MMNIGDGSVPLQHKDAQVALAGIFRGTSPTDQEMRHVYAHLGGTMDSWNQFVANLETGDLSPEQIRQVTAAAKTSNAEHIEDVGRFRQSARLAFGPGSGLELMPDQAQAKYNALLAELGMTDPEPLYPTEGGVILGSGKKPKVHARAPGAAKPPVAPKAQVQTKQYQGKTWYKVQGGWSDEAPK